MFAESEVGISGFEECEISTVLHSASGPKIWGKGTFVSFSLPLYDCDRWLGMPMVWEHQAIERRVV
jgi:hypothetical protein